MPDQSLTLLIDPTDLTVIKTAQQRIALGKTVNGNPVNIIWLSVDPLASNIISWPAEYGLYASASPLKDGSPILKLAEAGPPVQNSAYYTFTPAGLFNGPHTGSAAPPASSYAVQNDMPYASYPSLVFGLTQSALVNQRPVDRKPLSATILLATQYLKMTPSADLYVWLQGDFASETIITTALGKSTKVTFSPTVTSVTLKYNPHLGLFTPSDAQGKLLDQHAAVLLLRSG